MKLGDCANVYSNGKHSDGMFRGAWWRSRYECDLWADPGRVAVIRIKAPKHDKA